MRRPLTEPRRLRPLAEPRRLGWTALALTAVALTPLLAGNARAQAPAPQQQGPAPQAEDATSEQARAAFVEGIALAKQARWSQALEAFRRAETIRAHPVTTYNIGTCHRAIGAYTRAFLVFKRALREHEAPNGDELPAGLVAQSRAFIDEIDRLLVTLDLEVQPAGATIAVDGRPLLAQATGTDTTHWAGIRGPGPGEAVSGSRMRLRLDPGLHVFTFARPGFETAVVNETFAPGTSRPMQLRLDTLPARLEVVASVPGALVSLDDREIGPAPISVLRPAGGYRLLVEKDGYEAHRAPIALSAGQQLTVRVPMKIEQTSVFETWWFWSAAAVVVAGGITTTYFLTRPDPETPPYDGGSLDWVVSPEAAQLRF
jgi:PEGA domain